jgi:predicted lipoprotein with Yx(FWY)xxD motif
MKRTPIILATALLGAACVATVAGARQDPHSAHASRATVVALRSTPLGKILVSSSGRTLYEFTRDHAGKNSCVSISGCAEVWPALQSSGGLSAGPGVKASLLSTIKLPNGAKQVTYAGHPLYLYSADSGPGETSYVGAREFGGLWEAVNSSGHALK